MTPYTALVARALLVGRLDAELKHSRPGYFREKLIEQREMAIAFLIEGMHDRNIRTAWSRVADEYVRQAWEEVTTALEEGAA